MFLTVASFDIYIILHITGCYRSAEQIHFSSRHQLRLHKTLLSTLFHSVFNAPQKVSASQPLRQQLLLQLLLPQQRPPRQLQPQRLVQMCSVRRISYLLLIRLKERNLLSTSFSELLSTTSLR